MTSASRPTSGSPLPSFRFALFTLLAVVAVIGFGLSAEISLHSLLLICLIVASLSASHLEYDFNAIRQAMNSGIQSALSAIYIFILIGVLIASLTESGTLATLIYHGLDLVHPVLFLPGCLLLCSFMSIATGTSWGTVGTVGMILTGIGSTMGIPAPIIAGAVISGACFGDKMSPMSDTTNLAAMTSGVNLHSHIKSMLYTTGPAYCIALVIFTLTGLQYSNHLLPAEDIKPLQVALDSQFTISLWTLLPLIIMLGLSLKKVAAEVAMMSASIVAVLLAFFLQQQDLSLLLNSLYSGSNIDTGISKLDQILSRGGITAMMWTLSLSLMALALGGILKHCQFLTVLALALLSRIKRAASLVAATIICCFTGNIALGEAYMSIILGGQLFNDAYNKKGIKRQVLSRSLEEGSTLTVALIPWTTGGAFFASALGVSVLDYAPWALLNWINPLLSIAFAYFGIALFREAPHKTATQSTAAQPTQS